jgi:hypothetical protein
MGGEGPLPGPPCPCNSGDGYDGSLGAPGQPSRSVEPSPDVV